MYNADLIENNTDKRIPNKQKKCRCLISFWPRIDTHTHTHTRARAHMYAHTAINVKIKKSVSLVIKMANNFI